MARTILLPLTEAAVLHVARHMRSCDRREIFATRFDEDAAALAGELVAVSRFGIAAATDGVPAAALGYVECWPGFWTGWMFATDAWPMVAGALTRFARRALMPALVEAGAHRCECKSIADNDAAHRWLSMLGARAEAVHPDFGRNRETFVTFAWRLDHVRRFLLTETEIAPAAGAHRRCRDRGGRD
jgi:hypothetical protein